ncbi:MAG: hypothetical protein WD795_08855 [Woeseia sp.]
MADERYDTLIRNAKLARPGEDELAIADIGILDGKFIAIAPGLGPAAPAPGGRRAGG